MAQDGLWHLEDSRARAENGKTQFSGATKQLDEWENTQPVPVPPLLKGARYFSCVRYPPFISLYFFLLAYGVQLGHSGMSVEGATPEPKQYFLALCSSNNSFLDIQKHFFWPMVCRSMGVWGATPEPEQYFLALCSSNTPMPGIQKHLFWSMGYSGMGVWSATPEPKQYFQALCSSNTPILGIQKHLFWSMACRGMGV